MQQNPITLSYLAFFIIRNLFFKFFYYSENMITIEISVGGGNTDSGAKIRVCYRYSITILYLALLQKLILK